MIRMECKDCIYFKGDVCERHCSRVFRSNNICEYFVSGKHKMNGVKKVKMTDNEKYNLKLNRDELMLLENMVYHKVEYGGTTKEMRLCLTIKDYIDEILWGKTGLN